MKKQNKSNQPKQQLPLNNNPIHIQSNNFNIVPNIFNEIFKKPEYESFVIDYLEKEQNHRIEIEKETILLEKREQNIRKHKSMSAIIYTFIGQISSIIFLCLFIYLIIKGETSLETIAGIGGVVTFFIMYITKNIRHKI